MHRFHLLFPLFALFAINGFSQENLAKKTDYLSTSFVSSWEKLNAVNDGIEPGSSSDKQGAAYGNWNNNDNNRWHWVEYRWNQYQMINRSEVYWWADGSGILIPSECFLQYWDLFKQTWVELPGSRGPGISNRYQSFDFETVLTNRIRINMTSSIATGILEWKVWGSLGEQVPVKSTSSIDQALAKGSKSHIVLAAKNLDGTLVSGYQFKCDIILKNNLTENQENYLVNGVPFTQSVLGYSLPPTNERGEIQIELELPQTIDPTDGISISPLFNNGLNRLEPVFSFFEPGKEAPALNLVNQTPSVDAPLEFTFADQPAWRSSVLSVVCNNDTLSSGIGYQLSEGKLKLVPSNRVPGLTKSGFKALVIGAAGYKPVRIEFFLYPGQADAERSTVVPLMKLFRGVSTQIVLTLYDRFNNPVAAQPVSSDIEIVNQTSSTNEKYTLGGVVYSTGQQAVSLGNTNSLGQIQVPIVLPSTVDKNDGIKLSFTVQGEKKLTSTVEYIRTETEKGVLIQATAKKQPDFSWQRTAQSDNFILIWGEKVKGDPTDRALNPSLWFNPKDILTWLEEMYVYYSGSMGMLDTKGTMVQRYKFELVLNNTWRNDVFTGWAFGSSADNTIGSMWIDPGGVRDNSVLAHEFTHACQAQILIDKPGYGLNIPASGFFWESHANWTRALYNQTHDGLPERYINTSMMHFSTTRRHYQNFAFLDYVYDRYGVQTVSKIWRMASATKSHPLTSFRDSVLHLTQDELNDELALCAMHNVTWDYSMKDDIKKVVSNINPDYLGREYTILDSLKSEPGKFIVPWHLAPGDYGYNIIPLYPDEGASSVSAIFRGLENNLAGGSGSRYGFVAVDQTGKVRYSPVYKESDTSASFPILPGDKQFYLVVTGAPKSHHNYEWEAGFPKIFRYPYVVEFKGATPAGHKPGYNSLKQTVQGTAHPNGGGWVASTAKVDTKAFVGPNAQVLGTAQVSGNARVEGYAIVKGSARLSENAIVKDHAVVGGASVLSGSTVVEKTARVFGSTLRNYAIVSGSALCINCTFSGNVIVGDLAWLWNSSLSGTVIVGGDAEEYTGCSSGTYLEIKRTGSCDGNINHSYDQDINLIWPEYTWPMGDKPTAPVNLKAEDISQKSVTLSWDASSGEGTLRYYVLQGSNVIATVSSNRFQVENLDPAKNYNFQIQAIDSRANRSAKSNVVSVKTLAVSAEQVETAASWVEIFPNPVKNQLHIRVLNGEGANLTLYNSSGSLILSRYFNSELLLPHTEIGPTGIYSLTLQTGKKRLTKKIVLR